jgi:hypothetical protein
MKAEVKQEALRWVQAADGEKFELAIGIELDVPKGIDKGQVGELRKAASLSITRLARLLRDSQAEAQGEKQIKVETVQPEGRPYRVSRKTFGEEVPGMPWKPGGPYSTAPTEALPETTKE